MRVSRVGLILELVGLWVGLPTVIALLYGWGGATINPFFLLWPVALGCLVGLWRSEDFDRGQLWSAGALGRFLPGVLRRAAVLGPVLAVVIWLTLRYGLDRPEWFLGFPRNRPVLWAVVMVAYPVVSVYPQGMIYRAFFLHRYRRLIGDQRGLAVVAGLIFGCMHIIFLNPVAPLITAVGGVLFAYTHMKSRSLLVSSIEHAIYGCLIFTLGWGKFFYHGSVNIFK